MKINNIKVREALQKLENLTENKGTAGYYLDTYNSRPDLSSKKYHLYAQVIGFMQAQKDYVLESFNTQKEFIDYVNSKIK